MSTEGVIVTCTTDAEQAANELAAGAVNAGLAACAQVVGPVTSVFRWDGQVNTEQEWRLDMKTAGDRVGALTEHLKDAHSYNVPEIIATPIVGGSTEYLQWLVSETRG